MKLAIVGAGIGGCSTAYFSQKMIPGASITVFEAHRRIGGRIMSMEIGPSICEIGATFFLPTNKCILELVDQLGLETETLSPSFGIWDGSRLILKSGSRSSMMMLNLLLRYGSDAFRLSALVRKARSVMLSIYRGLDKPNSTLEDLLKPIHEKGWQATIFRDLLEEEKIRSSFIDELLDPLTRLIYCQDTRLNGFAGLVTMAGILGPTLHIKVGNEVLPKRLLESSGAEVRLGQHAKKLVKNAGGSFTLTCEPDFSGEFDAVVLAAPIEQLGISFENMDVAVEKRKFQRLHSMVVTGELNPQYFGLHDLQEVPAMIMTSKESDAPFMNLISLGKDDDGHYLYHLISDREFENQGFELMFRRIIASESYVLEHAYPNLVQVSSYQPIALDNNLYYINGIESVASTMESSVLAAKNVVMLLSKQMNPRL